MTWHIPAVWLDVLTRFGEGMAHGRADDADLETVVRCMAMDSPHEGRGDLVAFLIWYADKAREREAWRIDLATQRVRRAAWKLLEQEAPPKRIRTELRAIAGLTLTTRELAGLWRSVCSQFDRRERAR